MRRRPFWLLCLAVLAPAALPAPEAAAQPVDFGAADDPREVVQRVWWRQESWLDVRGGLSLIGPQWRAATSADLTYNGARVDARLGGTIRGGVFGDYGPDTDEWYDLLRLAEFVRYKPPRPESTLYLRGGLLRRTRLGTGHLVNFFSTAAAWDERTVGAELFASRPYGEVALFTDNVLVDGIVGGRAAATPLLRSPDPRLASLTLGLSYVTDVGTRLGSAPEGTPTLAAYDLDAQFTVLQSGAFALAPFASYAWYTRYGRSLSFGADLVAPNFIDLARLRVRLALYYSGRGFIPGYIGSFYTVNGSLGRIINSDRFFEDETVERLEGVVLAEATGGNSLMTDIRLLVFERFELWYQFRRHYGTQNLSEYHLRLFTRVTDTFRLNFGVDRGGLGGLLTLLNEFGDQTHLVFDLDYRVAGALWLSLQSRYTFERIGPGPGGAIRFVNQRRFEPFVGARVRF